MGIQDFEAMYDTIDLKRKGYITSEQIHKFCETLYYSPLCVQHIEGAVRDKCGSGGMVTRQEFLDVFVEIERRRATEEQAYWDFQALDYTASHRISLRDALLLFREIHGDQFSLTTWRHFLSSRESPDEDVYFDEIRFWLCSLPSGKPCSDKELKEEENKLLMRQTDYAYNQYGNIQAELDNEKEKEDYEDEMTRHAQRKLNKWNDEGVKAMLFDDGQDDGQRDVRTRVKGPVTLTHINELIERKYKSLQERLMQEMATNAAAMADEQAEILRAINRGWKTLLKQGQSFDGTIPGGRVQLLSSLTGLMGELHQEDLRHRKQVEELKVRLRSEGKTQREISLAIQELYEQIISGESSCQAVLLEINKRYHQERESVTTTLHHSGKNMSDAIQIEYCRLMRQLLVLEDEDSFVAIATAVGLAEREMEPRIDRFDWDRSRSERLAQFRLEAHKGQKPLQTLNTLPDQDLLETGGTTELQVEIVKEATKKHFYEREAIIHLLQSNENMTLRSKTKKMKPEERKQALKSLQSQHKNWKSNPRADKSVLHRLLKEALWLRYEERRLELEIITPNVSEEEMCEVLLADLQQKQGLDCQGLIQMMYDKKKPDLMLLLKKECKARIDETYDNIVYVVLGTLEIGADEEDHIRALEEKYDALRKRIFFMALREQHGNDWKEFSLEEKQSAMRDLIKKEKVLRSESRLQDMVNLIGPKGRLLPTLRSLMGEEKGEYQRRISQDKTEEDSSAQMTAVNVLADLLPRCDGEQEYLLRWLQSPEAKGLTLRMKNMTLVELKIETQRIEMEDDFEIAALSGGLMERIAEALSRRHTRDEDRQTQLSRKRVQLRQRRLVQMEEYSKEPEIERERIPKKGDITGLQIVYLHEMLKRHQDERELMLGHLQDDSMEDLIDAAKSMTDEDRQKRLAELQGKRQNLNFSYPDDQEVNLSIIEEAAAIQTVCTMEQLSSQGQSTTMEAVSVALLVDLQDEQDREIAAALRGIENMDEEEIRTRLHGDLQSRQDGRATNVFTVLTRYSGEAQDDELIQALEAKYQVLREKLLVDSLVGRIGSDQWQALSYKEKQQKLAALDAQVIEQEKIGRVMPALLGEGFVLKEGVSQLMGVGLHVFKNKVKGQIEVGNHMNLRLEEYEGAVKKKNEPENPLKDLHNRLEEEKHDLIKHLKGQTDEYFSEHDRQIQLLCYKRERKLASEVEGFTNAATLVGLLERQQEDIKYRLLKDKERYERLAKQEILLVERQKERKMVDTASNSREFMVLTESVLDLLEGTHIQERQLFYKLLADSEKYEDLQQVAALSSQQQRLDKLAELREARKKSVEDKQTENMNILTEATVYKKENRRSHITADGKDVTFDDLSMSLMADLLEYQNSEAQRILRMLIRKSEDEVSSYQHKILQDRKSNMADNIALVVFSPERSDGSAESDLIEALKGKYDALKDKLLAEALMKELGESNWNRMSETERQRKIFQLKLKERQLRKEGKIDEANALLGELLKEQEHLKQLMGESAEEQRRKLEERLKKRKQRKAAGMSDEEIDRLEKEEEEEEQEEERNKQRNLLEDLENRFEQEKDELLRRLQNTGDDLEKERERQANLARLRRDERLARDEDKFGSAALILGLAEKQDKDLRLSKDEERKRQEKLARERIEAARQRRRQGRQLEDGEIVAPDTEDPASLQEAIARHLDKKHHREMEYFMRLLDDASSSRQRKQAASMSDEERDDKLYELSELHNNWLRSEVKDTQEQTDIFMEATGCQMEVIKHQLDADGRSSTDDDIQVALVANLQEAQKLEALRLLDEIEDKDLKSLQQLYKARTTISHDDQNKNIATVLLGDQKSLDEELSGETTEANVLSALEQKYDAIKDKLLIEALMKQHGEREWAEMSEKQRQKKLIELKLKERQLRKEGKLDEIANLIGSHLENEKLLDELLGASKKTQQERLNERLARRKQLIAEREAAGLNTDDATIEAIIEDEEIQEEKRKRRNILEDLQKNFDDEKAALLRSLARQTDKVEQERHRQIEIAKLKRDQRQLKKNEKLDVVAMMIQSAKQDDRKREEGILAERERQRAIAKERLAARKQKKYQSTPEQQQTAEQLIKAEELSKMEDIFRDAEGRSIQEALLTTVERRQEEEMDLLMGLLEGAKTQHHLVNNARSKEDQELKSELTKLEHDQLRWRKKSKHSVLALKEETLTEDQGREHMAEVAQRRSDHLKLLMDAMVYRQEIERRMMLNKNPELQNDTDRLEEELMVALVTDLQEKQTAESMAIQKLIEFQDDDVVSEIKKSQHVACREGWFDNLTRTVFSLSKAEGTSEEIYKLDDSYREAIEELDEQFEREKEEALEEARRAAAEGEVIDEDAIIRNLQDQYDRKRQAMTDQMNQQKATMLEKLEARQLLKENKDYEDLAAKTLIKLAKEQHGRAVEGVKKEKGKQSTLLQQRLAQRREARKVAKQTKETTLDSFDNLNRDSSDESRFSTPSQLDVPFGGMRREKTVVDVDVSDEQKQAMYSQLMRQQQQAESKRAQQMMRQEEMLKRRLAARQGKQKDEAAEVLSIGQRQKTTLEKTQKDEKDRQLQKIEEKRARMKEKRDPSPKVKGKH